jgi:polyisoprenoid-binding protein YceI
MRLSTFVLAVSAFVISSTETGAFAQAKTFKVDSNGGSQIQFVSDAPLEKTTGVSSKISGDIVVDPNLPAQAKATLRVEVASIRTGIELRDEHLRAENWLDAKAFPNAEFVITSVSGVDKLKPNEAVEATIKGKFTIHGVTKDLTAKALVRWVPASAETQANKVKGDALRIQASFDVKLEDHKVSIPSIVSLKVAPIVKVNVDLRATAG